MKYLLVKLLLSSILILSCIGQTVFAKTDDAGVLAGLESNSDMYSYLNYYHYSLWLADHRYLNHDMYILLINQLLFHYGIIVHHQVRYILQNQDMQPIKGP